MLHGMGGGMKKTAKKKMKIKPKLRTKRRIKKPAKKYLRKNHREMDFSDRLISIQSYPLVLPAELDNVKVFSPDFEVVNSTLPVAQRLSSKQKKRYFAMVGEQVLRTWQAAERARKSLINKGAKIPRPPMGLDADINQSPNDVLSPDEVATKVGCHRDTVRRAIDRGELKSTLTPGGHRRIVKAEAKRWI